MMIVDGDDYDGGGGDGGSRDDGGDGDDYDDVSIVFLCCHSSGRFWLQLRPHFWDQVSSKRAVRPRIWSVPIFNVDKKPLKTCFGRLSSFVFPRSVSICLTTPPLQWPLFSHFCITVITSYV